VSLEIFNVFDIFSKAKISFVLLLKPSIPK